MDCHIICTHLIARILEYLGDTLAQYSRRKLLQRLASLGLLTPISGGLSQFLPLLNSKAHGEGGRSHRFLQIFLDGGWDSALSTDPVNSGSSKATSGAYEASYYNGDISNSYNSVSGKSNLFVGAGLNSAIASFSALPTAFINGMYVEVTAHELASAYMLSGQLSLSRSREYPAFIASMADKAGGFPAHVVLGGALPLGDTKKTNPPLQSHDLSQFTRMLAGPRAKDDPDDYVMQDETINAAHSLINKLNDSYQKRLKANAKNSLSAWISAEAGIDTIYSKRYDQTIALDSALHSDYSTGGSTTNMQAKMAGSFLMLREGLSRFITTRLSGFDTHQSHIASHLPVMQNFAVALKQLVDDLQATDDPDDSSKKLSQTTTILITSEFVRTPRFNLSAGTDHWQSGSAILMGKGIADNIVVGGTDDQAAARGWKDGGFAAFNDETKLLPDHLAASLMRLLGYYDEADKISEVHLSELFS